MLAIGKESSEARRRLRDCIGSRDPDRVKAFVTGIGDQRRLQLRGLAGQKSRLA
jgi:hypothetical protein